MPKPSIKSTKRFQDANAANSLYERHMKAEKIRPSDISYVIKRGALAHLSTRDELDREVSRIVAKLTRSQGRKNASFRSIQRAIFEVTGEEIHIPIVEKTIPRVVPVTEDSESTNSTPISMPVESDYSSVQTSVETSSSNQSESDSSLFSSSPFSFFNTNQTSSDEPKTPEGNIQLTPDLLSKLLSPNKYRQIQPQTQEDDKIVTPKTSTQTMGFMSMDVVGELPDSDFPYGLKI